MANLLTKAKTLVLILAAALLLASFFEAPTYEAQAQALTGQTDPDSRPVAEEVIRRLGLGAELAPDELLSDLRADGMGAA